MVPQDDIRALFDSYATIRRQHDAEDDPANGVPDDPAKAPEPEVQILHIKTVAYFTAATRKDAAAKTTQPQTYVMLSGSPSPRSQVTSAYLYFVPDAEMRPASYHCTRKEIRVWMSLSSLPQTLEQLRHRERHLQWRRYADGHIWSDLHSSP